MDMNREGRKEAERKAGRERRRKTGREEGWGLRNTERHNNNT